MRVKVTPQQISERELRKVAIHEAAHAVVAWHLGYLATKAEVFRVENPGEWDRTWTGRVWFYQQPSVQDGRFIGLAGYVAEQLQDDDEITGACLLDYLDLDAADLSATDARFAAAHTEADLEDTLMLVRWCWEEINTRAAHLMRRARVEAEAEGAA